MNYKKILTILGIIILEIDFMVQAKPYLLSYILLVHCNLLYTRYYLKILTILGIIILEITGCSSKSNLEIFESTTEQINITFETENTSYISKSFLFVLRRSRLGHHKSRLLYILRIM